MQEVNSLRALVAHALLLVLAISAAGCSQPEDPRNRLHDAQRRQAVSKVVEPGSQGSDLLAAVGLPRLRNGEKRIDHKYYRSAFSKEHNQPVWVAWRLVPSMAQGPHKRGPFVTDPKVLDDAELVGHAVEADDYSNSGQTRGHMMPVGDCKFDATASAECMYMTNMCPQTAELNSGPWNQLESRCRNVWARNEGELLVISGPIFCSQSPRVIGQSHNVSVPDRFFKIVVSLKRGDEKAIAFILPNNHEPGSWQEAATNIGAVEKATGLVFLTNLGPESAARLKAECDLDRWKKKRR